MIYFTALNWDYFLRNKELSDYCAGSIRVYNDVKLVNIGCDRR